tara:strand:+ start:64 stop:477 length:414 start_codon:yes stop_codon:yes gene_type:complete
MTNTDNIISETLGILSSPTKSPITIPKKISLVSTTEDDIDNDYKYQRENLYNLIERGQDAIDGILELAKEGEHPRAYEVALNGIKQVADVTDKLIDLQDKMKKLKELPNSAPKNVTNALFVGSTAELQKMLKDKSDG